MKPVYPERNGVRNRLLGRLPAEDFRRLRQRLERVDFKARSPLYEPRVPFAHVYFPETGVGSIVTVLDDGTETEVATVGQEGMLGLPAFLGAALAPHKVFWQVPGTAWRLPVEALRGEKRRAGALSEALGLYAQAFFTQLAQAATCHRRHQVQQRCIWWLLNTHDRVEGDEFELTQEFLAKMLGVRRAGVTVVAGALQRAGLIRYARGWIGILDREGLEAASCECYRLVREEFERLLD
jgi:CRP-like cAMP-binding protein